MGGNNYQTNIIQTADLFRYISPTMSDSEDDLDKESIGRKAGLCLSNILVLRNVQAIEELSSDKLAEYREIFSFFDRDGGGSIGADEFEQVMRTFGWNPGQEELRVNQKMVSKK